MLSGKRLLRQALPLTVRQIICLRNILTCEEAHITDRAVIAYILFALYGRCRNSDLLHIRSMHFDFNAEGGFAIIETCNHKSGRMAALKTRLMPIIVPARGVDGSIWISFALSVFQEAGVSLENPIDGPLMHAPAGGVGFFMRRGFRTAEISSMLRRFLDLQEPSPGSSAEIVSSHSLKATMLSWCASCGRQLPPDSQRSEFFKPDMHEGLCTDRGEVHEQYSPVPSAPYEPSLADDWEKVGVKPIKLALLSTAQFSVSATMLKHVQSRLEMQLRMMKNQIPRLQMETECHRMTQTLPCQDPKRGKVVRAFQIPPDSPLQWE
eukprot:s116_g39.t1